MMIYLAESVPAEKKKLQKGKQSRKSQLSKLAKPRTEGVSACNYRWGADHSEILFCWWR